MSRSLWGPPPAELPRVPLTVLDEQAAALSTFAHQVVLGEVATEAIAFTDLILPIAPVSFANGRSLTLRARVPALDDYIVDLVRVSHGLLPYPVMVRSLVVDQGPALVEDEAGFVRALELILTGTDMRRVILGLIAAGTQRR